MSNNSTPRLPVRFVEHNRDLLKAQAGASHEATDYREEVTVATVSQWPQHEYRVPDARNLGNPLFRRYTNGSLDYDYACAKVIDALHRVKDSGGVDVLNHLEHTALSVLFPSSFFEVDPAMAGSVATVQLRLSPMEAMSIRMKVASHLAAEMNWNAGFGG